MIDGGCSSLELEGGEEDDLNEGHQLTIDEPDVHQAHVGGWGELLHHTETDNTRLYPTELDCQPDKECGGHQHHRQVDSHRGLEVEGLEMCGGVTDAEQKEGGQVGGEQLVDQSPFELDLHFDTCL